jgi:hypothetical protein
MISRTISGNTGRSSESAGGEVKIDSSSLPIWTSQSGL